MTDIPGRDEVPGATTVAEETRSVLLAVRLRATGDTPQLVDALATMGLACGDVGRLLDRLALAGLVERRGERAPGCRLTADGRGEGERLLGLELDHGGARAAVTAAYEDFLPLNGALLRACTAWQLVDADPSSLVVNDHLDPAYDAAVLDRLDAVHAGALPVCAALSEQLPRFAVYGPRFTAAIERARAGDPAAFDGPSIDSYHGTWFELHDHLLATLGRDRGSEPLP